MRSTHGIPSLLAVATLVQGLATAAWAAPAPTGYVVLTSGVRSGEMTVTAADHRRQVTLRYNDRGRGPDTRSVILVDDRLEPTSLSVDGVDYYKLPVAERFSETGGKATWRAANDRGAVAVTGFYFPNESNPEHLAMLARALLRAPGRTLPLLPGGVARIEHLVDRDAVLGGVSRKIRLYAISGLDFGPRAIWLDDKDELVLEGGDWLATVRADALDSAKTLIAVQAAALDARDLARAPGLMRRPGMPVAFRAVSLFDSETRALRPDMTVVVEGDRITMVGPTAAVPIPTGAEVVDGTGKTLLPGLWDMHVHLVHNYDGLLHLSAGVTSTRDLANTLDELARRKQRFDEGQLAGPRIVRAGFIDGPGPLAGPIKVLVSTPDEMRAAIRDYAAQGMTEIKLYSSLDPRLVPVAADEAHRLGLRLSGHVPAGMTMREAVAAGYDEVHHINFPALNFMSPEINAKTNGITRITAIAEHAWELNLDDQRTADFITYLKVRGTTLDPTLAIFTDQLVGLPGQAAPSLAPVIDRLPPAVRRASMGTGLARNPAEVSRNALSAQRLSQLLLKLYQGGVPLVPGTDTMAGFTYQRELELYVEAGVPTRDVLYMATLGSARVASLESRLGSVEPGKLADMVLVDGDPVARMSDIRKVELVMKDGVLFQPDRLLAEVGVRPAAGR